jgi:hypothetical protein
VVNPGLLKRLAMRSKTQAGVKTLGSALGMQHNFLV